MTRITKYGKPYSARFLKHTEKDLLKYCLDRELNPSDVIHDAVECFLHTKNCKARKDQIHG